METVTCVELPLSFVNTICAVLLETPAGRVSQGTCMFTWLALTYWIGAAMLLKVTVTLFRDVESGTVLEIAMVEARLVPKIEAREPGATPCTEGAPAPFTIPPLVMVGVFCENAIGTQASASIQHQSSRIDLILCELGHLRRRKGKEFTYATWAHAESCFPAGHGPVTYTEKGGGSRTMSTDVLTALISAGAAVITAVTALLLNYRGFSSIESRLTALESSTNARFLALENRMDARFNAIQADLKEFYRLLADHDKRIQRLEDKP